MFFFHTLFSELCFRIDTDLCEDMSMSSTHITKSPHMEIEHYVSLNKFIIYYVSTNRIGVCTQAPLEE